MSFDSMAVLRSDFPDPVEQARAVLEICDDNIQVARSLVWTQLKLAKNLEEIHYWCKVEKSLSKEASALDLNTLSDEDAER